MSGATAQQKTPRGTNWSSSLLTLFSPQRAKDYEANLASLSPVEQVGETAGHVWRVLVTQGPTELSRLAKEIGAPRDLVVLAVGWLGREGKIEIEEESRRLIVSLR